MSVATSTTLATAGRSAPRVGAASRAASRHAVVAPACGCGVAGNCAHVRTGPFVLRADRRRVSAVAARASSDDGSKRDVGFGTTPRGMGFFNNDDTSSSSSSSLTLRSTPLASLAPLFLLADGGLADDIKPSYFASLGLFILSAPGLWSLVKRSAKSKVDRKTFEVAGPAAEAAMPLDELAREISMFFRRNNYVVADAGEVIVFEGNIAPEKGTAAYITFCVAIGLLCIGLVCSIALPGGNLWYSMALLSPLSGSYYMENAGRKEQMKVKMVTADDDMTTDIIVEGDVEEIERMRRDLNLIEKGKVYVKGILEQ